MNPALLAIETATDVCGIALHDGTSVIASAVLRQRQQHGRSLVPMIEQALANAQVRWDDLGAVAVSAGPGSYTGLRIGLSVAKGLCAARDLALVAVPSLDALAAQVQPFVSEGDLVGAAFNSRRGEVYAAWFAATDGRLETVHAPVAAPLTDPIPPLPNAGTVWLVGEGAALVSPLVAHPDVRVVPNSLLASDPASVARLGVARWRDGRVEDVASFEPDYLKPFVAREAAPVP